jgi:hypothetical protein
MKTIEYPGIEVGLDAKATMSDDNTLTRRYLDSIKAKLRWLNL